MKQGCIAKTCYAPFEMARALEKEVAKMGKRNESEWICEAIRRRLMAESAEYQKFVEMHNRLVG